MKRARLGRLLGTSVLGLAGRLPLAAAASGWDELNMPRGVTSASKSIYALHMMALWVCVGIAVVVFGVMIWSLIFHRKSRGAVPDVTLTHSTKVEVVWTAVPVLILIGMAIPAARLLLKINNNTDPQVNIRVTGFQWGWRYQYLGTPVSVISKLSASSNDASQMHSGIRPTAVPHYLLSVDHQVVVPVGEKVRLLITSIDVIHSWWVPDLGVKRDAIPGYINEASFTIAPNRPGIYRGQCTELCGRGHAYMPIVVRAVTPAAYEAWLKQHSGPPSEAATHPPAAAVTRS